MARGCSGRRGRRVFLEEPRLRLAADGKTRLRLTGRTAGSAVDGKSRGRRLAGQIVEAEEQDGGGVANASAFDVADVAPIERADGFGLISRFRGLSGCFDELHGCCFLRFWFAGLGVCFGRDCGAIE